MLKDVTQPSPPVGKTANVHIGFDRFAEATQYAIDVSADTRIQITASQFVQHLVDHYGEIAKANWLVTLANAQKKKEQLAKGI